MTIRNKLLMAFGVALGLLVAQFLSVTVFIGQLQTTVGVVTDIVMAREADYQATELLARMQKHAKALADSDKPAEALAPLRVYWAEIASLADKVHDISTTVNTNSEALQGLPQAVTAAQQELDKLEKSITSNPGDTDTILEHSIFLEEALAGLAELLSMLNVDLGHSQQAAVQQEQSVHNRPIQAGRAICGAAAVLLAVFGWTFASRFVKPVLHMADVARKIADGEINQHIDYQSRDEIGALAGALNHMAENLRQMVKSISDNTLALNDASDDLSGISGGTLDKVREMHDRANVVAASAKEMSANMTIIVATANEATSNIDMVANATDEMASTVTEIAENAEKARGVTTEAVHIASSTSNRVGELSHAAEEISKVTEVIVDIAEQTKLLALNATIEAARAGESGRGFAVVANEVKELAQQTNDATEDIRQKIETMQRSTSGTVSEIEQISRVITDIADLVANIATAVEEQAITNRDIANNIGHAAGGIKDMTGTITAAADISEAIATDVGTVSQASGEMETVSTKLSTQATGLAEISHELKTMVDKFRLTAQT